MEEPNKKFGAGATCERRQNCEPSHTLSLCKVKKKIQQTDLIKYFMTDWLDIICPEQGVRVLPLLTQLAYV